MGLEFNGRAVPDEQTGYAAEAATQTLTHQHYCACKTRLSGPVRAYPTRETKHRKKPLRLAWLGDDNLPEVRATRHVLQRLACLLERKRFIDDWLQAVHGDGAIHVHEHFA